MVVEKTVTNEMLERIEKRELLAGTGRKTNWSTMKLSIVFSLRTRR